MGNSNVIGRKMSQSIVLSNGEAISMLSTESRPQMKEISPESAKQVISSAQNETFQLELNQSFDSQLSTDSEVLNEKKRKNRAEKLNQYFEVMKRRRAEKRREMLQMISGESMLETLPVEILVTIMKFLEGPDVVHLAW